MKRLALLLAFGSLAGATFARLPEAGSAVHPTDVDGELQAVFAAPGGAAHDHGDQTVGTDNGRGTGVATGLSLADALTVERRASLWWEYARDVASVTTRLTRKGETTLLVPTDRAIMRLPRKPHQNADGSVASEKEARANVEAFLAAHIVPGLLEPETATPTLYKGVNVTLDGEEGSWIIQPGDITVVGATQASNGKIYYLDGVVTTSA